MEEHKERCQAYCDRADRFKKVGKVKEAIEDYAAAINDQERIIAITRDEYNITSGEEMEQPKRDIERLKGIEGGLDCSLR